MTVTTVTDPHCPTCGAELAAPIPLVDALTTRQREVLNLLVTTSLTLSEIGRRLYISRNTVKIHAHAVYAKTGARGRTQLIQVIAKGGVFDNNVPGNEE